MDKLLETIIKLLGKSLKMNILLNMISGIILIIYNFNFPEYHLYEILKAGSINICCTPKYLFYFWCIIIYIATFVIICFRPLLNRLWHKDVEKIKDIFQSKQMGESIEIIYDWFKINKENPLEVYKKQFEHPEKRTEIFKTTHITRRWITEQYQQVMKYKKRGYCSKGTVKEFIHIQRVNFLLNRIEPLEAQIGDDYDKTVFKFFRKIYKKELIKIT